MGQMIVKEQVGTVGLGLFLVGMGAFAYSALDLTFGPMAIGSLLGGTVVAAFLLRRRPARPTIDPRLVDASEAPPPMERRKGE